MVLLSSACDVADFGARLDPIVGGGVIIVDEPQVSIPDPRGPCEPLHWAAALFSAGCHILVELFVEDMPFSCEDADCGQVGLQRCPHETCVCKALCQEHGRYHRMGSTIHTTEITGARETCSFGPPLMERCKRQGKYQCADCSDDSQYCEAHMSDHHDSVHPLESLPTSYVVPSQGLPPTSMRRTMARISLRTRAMVPPRVDVFDVELVVKKLIHAMGCFLWTPDHVRPSIIPATGSRAVVADAAFTAEGVSWLNKHFGSDNEFQEPPAESELILTSVRWSGLCCVQCSLRTFQFSCPPRMRRMTLRLSVVCLSSLGWTATRS